MKIYRVKVNGKVYEVELEAIKEVNQTIQVQPKETSSLPSQANVTSPMQGQIVKVLVAKGDKVKKGQVLCILEAMKLENEIVAPKDGIIQEVLISAPAKVDASQGLFVIG